MGQSASTPANNEVVANVVVEDYDAKTAPDEVPDDFNSPFDGPYVQVLYGSQTLKKNASRLANVLGTKYAVSHSPYPVSVTSMDKFEPEHLSKLTHLVIVVSTYTDGKPPTNALNFYNWLQDAVQDFRIHKRHLSHVKFAVFGLGSSDYKQNYNVVAKNMRTWLTELGAKSLCRPGNADYSNSIDSEYTPEQVFERWCLNSLVPALRKSAADVKGPATTTTATTPAEVEEPAAEMEEGGCGSDVYETESEEEENYSGEELEDVEDLSFGPDAKRPKVDAVPKKMITPQIRASLTKQGYKLIGSHSGVKLCRWTKAQLRGRGGCYKHTFYGIISSQCMEMTPSLACANKCVFCWRSHTNPVGTEWKWETDRPELVIKGALENHRAMINTLKGVPGVKPDRFAAALKPKHCALSLVGEPIMYPYINEFVEMLHKEDISSFMVTNAQFPEQMKTLLPITQLYLSIDADTKDTLKAVDRPLNPDYWERYLSCMEILRSKPQRTVYRLTLMKGSNMDDVAEYARLVSIGMPTFIEVKGVTYCGSDEFTMKEVPFHEEVREWCLKLAAMLGDRYELACEHKHSCCILISDKKMKNADGEWLTWIDYPKFQELNNRYRETGEQFTAIDYSTVTPSWAVFGAEEKGFSPNETRVYTKGKNKGKTPQEVDAQSAQAATVTIDEE